MGKRYICYDCGEGHIFSKKPSFCSNCGSSNIGINNLKAKAHAQELIDKMNNLVPQIESAWQTYINLYVEFENIRRIAWGYARKERRIINNEDIPSLKKKRHIDALYEYRTNRKDKQK